MREKPLILIVDDEPDFIEILSTKLAGSEVDLVAAHNGKEGVDAAKKLHPDLILMDVHMPGETGTDAALEIKQNPATRDIKVAFLSNMKDPWPQTEAPRDSLAKGMGMEDFIDKTADLETIVARIKTMLKSE